MEGDVGGSIVVESGDDHRGCYRGMSGDSCIVMRVQSIWMMSGECICGYRRESGDVMIVM